MKPPVTNADGSDWNAPLFPALFSCALAALTYSNALECGFVFDDHLAIEGNQDVVGSTALSGLLGNDFWGKPLVAVDSNKSWRPFAVLSFRLQAQRSRIEEAGTHSDVKLDAMAFHAANVALHALVSGGVALLGAELWGQERWTVALVSGAVFAVHPVHVEVLMSRDLISPRASQRAAAVASLLRRQAVTGVVGRCELLMALLCLAASASYRRAVHVCSHSTAGSPSRRLCGTAALRSLAHGTAALLWFVLALWSKETAITLIAVLIVYDHARLARARVWWRPTSGTLLRGSLLAALGYGYLWTRMQVMSIGGVSSWESASLSTSQLARARKRRAREALPV